MGSRSASKGIGYAQNSIRIPTVPKRIPPELAFDSSDFKATILDEGIAFQGKLLFRNTSQVLGPWLQRVHEAILTARIKEFRVDVTQLYHANSSSLFLFIDWARWIANIPQPDRYRLNFHTHADVSWQQLSLPTMQRICTGYILVTIVK